MYDLVGVDGNAFSVMAYVVNAMREQGFSREEQKNYQNAAMSGSYDNLLAVSFEMIEQCNERAGF